MICPGTNIVCDNPGCRHGGCQGRLPELPLFQSIRAAEPQAATAPAAADARDAASERLAA